LRVRSDRYDLFHIHFDHASQIEYNKMSGGFLLELDVHPPPFEGKKMGLTAIRTRGLSQVCSGEP
jgi:hypothetical protein